MTVECIEQYADDVAPAGNYIVRGHVVEGYDCQHDPCVTCAKTNKQIATQMMMTQNSLSHIFHPLTDYVRHEQIDIFLLLLFDLHCAKGDEDSQPRHDR